MMNRLIKSIFHTLLLVICALDQLYAQKDLLLQFEHYSSDQGLSNRNARYMMVDSKGFLWIATIDGLNRYDGYDFKIFLNNPFDKNTMSIGWPVAMAEDKNGMIWIACTTAQGLNRYDPRTQKFTRYTDDARFKKLLPESYVNYIYADDENNLWLSSDGEGLYRFNPQTNETRIYSHSENDTTTLGENSPLVVCSAGKNELYVSTSYGFDILNITTGKCRHFRINKNIVFSNMPLSHAVNIFKDHEGKLWIGTQQGLKMFDPITEKIITYNHQEGDPRSISCDYAFDMCESPDGRLWITTYGGGLNIFNRSTGKFDHCLHNDADANSVSDNELYQIVYHPSGKIWIQSEFDVNAVNLQPSKFKIFTHDPANKKSVSNNSVGTIYRDRQDRIFVCTFPGLNLYDPYAMTFQLYQPDKRVNDILRSSNIDLMYEDRESNYWFSADENKVVMYNPVSKKSAIFHTKENQPDSLQLSYIWEIYEDSRGIMWFSGPPFSCTYDPHTGKFTRHLFDPSKPTADLNGAGTTFMERNGKMWVTSIMGISYYDQKRDTFIHPLYKGHEAAEVLQQSWGVSCLAQDSEKAWIGTMGQGLFFINTTSGNCVNISSRDGLPNDVVWSILKDDRENLWIATNEGLCRFTPSQELLALKNDHVGSKGIFRTYNTSDGIPVKELSNTLPSRTANGQFLYSLYSDKGMFMFYPDSLKDNKYIPPVYITGFSLFNKEVIPSETNKFLRNSIETIKEIVLSYRENVFSFSFAALNFIHPENNKYAYKLEPFDRDWIYTDATKRFANYTNIDAGTYTFKVKGSNNDGVWNETPAEIRIIITPPFWKTLWFRILLGLLALSFLYSLYRFRLYQIIRLQNIRNKIAGDLHDEIGSTLNSISIYSEVARNKSKEDLPELKMIGEASRRVIDAMSDIVWTINPENDSFEKIIFRMRSLTHSLMKAKKIEYSFKADETLNELKLPMIERKNFYLIFKEALNNLVKYSNASRASVTLSQAGQQIELLIRDNGVGFDMNNIARGNGLNNMSRRAAEMKAQLAIDSRLNEGTSVQLLFNKKSKT